MATLDWYLDRVGGATLVELFVTSDADVRVEITSALQPVWPPRRRNRPTAGWSDSGFEGVVTAGNQLVLGYASPADPVEPPARIVGTEPVTGGSDEPPTPEQLVRSLGEAAPPRDAVPAERTATGHNAESSRQPAAWPPSEGPQQGERAANGASSGGGEPTTEAGRQDNAQSGVAVAAWLEAVEQRLDVAERLAAVETTAEARAAVGTAGGIEAVQRLCTQLENDRERLERIDAAELEERLATVEIPLTALERLA